MRRTSPVIGGVVGLILLLGPLGSHGPARAAASPGSVGTVTAPAWVRVLEGLPLLPPGTSVELGFVLGSSHPAALRAFDRAVSTPNSPSFHHFLSRALVDRRFGPSAAVIAHDRRLLARLGYRHLARQGWILFATASAKAIRRTLGVTLHRGRIGSAVWVAPVGRLHSPAGLQDVTVITGLTVREVGSGDPGRRPAPGFRWRPTNRVGRAPAIRPAGTTIDGYTVTTTLMPATPVLTGLPVTAQITVLNPDGTPDTQATIDTVNDSGPGSMWWNEPVGPDDQGNMGLTLTADTAGTYTVTVNVTPQSGAADIAVALPPITFTGDTAADGPVSPDLVNQVLGATTVVADAPSAPVSLGLYAEAAPDLADLQQFEQANNLAPLTVSTVPVGGYTPPPVNVNNGPDSELALDLQSVAMTAPGAHVVVTAVSPDASWPDGVIEGINAAAAADNVAVYSLSFGSAEEAGGLVSNQWLSSDLTAFEQGVEAANVEGITVVASSGDNGAYDDDGGFSLPLSPAVDVPAALPEVTAVGGIDFRVTPAGTGLATVAWGADTWLAVDQAYLQAQVNQTGTNGNLLTGGGYSQYFPVPAWQSAVLPSGASGRGVPDVALPASATFPGIAMVFGGSSTTAGGTSMAAPLFAGYLADIAAESGQRFGNVNPLLYQAAATDPTLMTQALYGYDGLYSVSPGPWNPLTGLGTPNIAALAADLGDAQVKNTPARITFQAPSVWVNAGHPLALAVTVTNAAGQALTAAVPVHLTIVGPAGYGTRTASGVITGDTLSALRFTIAGAYRVTVSAGHATASATVAVAPGWPATYRDQGPRFYVPGHLWREGVAAYDAYGNLDTRIRGVVLWTWRVGGHVYHARSAFHDGIAWGQFVVPRSATGTLTTDYTLVDVTQAPLP